MYGHILIATDGSTLAQTAVSHGLSLAKSVGAKVTALIVEIPMCLHRGCDRCPKPLHSMPSKSADMRRQTQVRKKLASSTFERCQGKFPDGNRGS
jgi:nucleotide-binding universal stress UspA family protein